MRHHTIQTLLVLAVGVGLAALIFSLSVLFLSLKPLS